MSVNAARETKFITNDLLQSELEKLKADTISSEELQTIIQHRESSLTREELTQQLIDTQKSRIGLLEGNITALLTLIAVIVAVLTLFGDIFVWFARKSFSSNVEAVEEKLLEMKKIREETATKVEAVRELSTNLNIAIREAEDLHISLNKSKSAFDDEINQIDQLRMYTIFLELQASRSEIYYRFENNVKNSKKIISKLEYWLSGTLPNYGLALSKITDVVGSNITKTGTDETIQDKLSYYIESLKKDETSFRKEAAVSLEWLDYIDLNTDEYTDPLTDELKDWEASYHYIKKIYEIISAQILMNPNRFKPKVEMIN